MTIDLVVPTLVLVASLITPPSTARPSFVTVPRQLSFASGAADADAGAHDSLVSHLAIAAFIVGQFADITTTEYGIGIGKVREANPIFRRAVARGPVTAGVAKGTVAVFVSWILLHVQEHHPTLAAVTGLVLAAAQGYVTWHNARLLGTPNQPNASRAPF